MNDLWGILVLLTIMVSIMGWWFNVIAYSRTEDLVVLVMVECVIVFIRRLMRRFMPMRRIWQPYTGPIEFPSVVAQIALERLRDENNITLGSRCRGRLRPALDAGGSRPPRHQ